VTAALHAALKPLQAKIDALSSEVDGLRMQDCGSDRDMEDSAGAAAAEKRKAAQGNSPEKKKPHTSNPTA
jgi:hypothetical protein